MGELNKEKMEIKDENAKDEFALNARDNGEEVAKDNENPEEELPKGKKIFKMVMNILGYVVIAILLVIDVFAIISRFQIGSTEEEKATSGGMSLFGYETRIVVSGSMQGSDEFYAGAEFQAFEHKDIKRIDIKDAIFIQRKDISSEENLNIWMNAIVTGDVLTFKNHGTADVITHRVVGINKDANGNVVSFRLQGDDPNEDTSSARGQIIQTVYVDWVIGKVTGVSKFLGNILFLITNNKIVLILVVIVPSSLLMLYEIGKVVYYVWKDKQEDKEIIMKEEQAKAQEEHQSVMKEKEDELAALRAELERMKKEQMKNESNDNK